MPSKLSSLLPQDRKDFLKEDTKGTDYIKQLVKFTYVKNKNYVLNYTIKEVKR